MPEAKRRSEERFSEGAYVRPPGVLPKNTAFWAVGLIVLVILAMSALSGKKKEEKRQEQKSVAGPSQSQLASFQKQLEEEAERLRLEAERRRVAEKLRNLDRPEVEPQPSVRRYSGGGGGTVVDPLAAKRRARVEASLSASNFAVRIEEKEAVPDRTSQIAVTMDATDADAMEAEGDEESVSGSSVHERQRVARPRDTKQKTPEESDTGHYLPSRVVLRNGRVLFRLFEGTSIQTILENALDGSFTGPVRCVVKDAVWSEDGEALLIPEGAVLLGEAKRVEESNQTRLAVSFKRLLRGDGYSIDLEAAPGLDSSGRIGLKDKVDNHRKRTFGISGLMGLLGGVAHFGGQGNPYAWGVGRSMGNSATNSLSRYLNAVPTITIRKGHPVMVYLPNDLLLPEYVARSEKKGSSR